ncbi:MAG TPA: carboxypeptidase regulatory-like domain-containing protein [Pyrinomonadaceae bacterium]|jgi:hypothetical protein
MKIAQLFWSFLALTLLTVLFSSAPYVQAQQPNNAPQSIKGVRERLAGAQGAPEREVTVNFASLASQQRLAPGGPGGEAREKEIDKPKPGPRDRIVPEDAVRSGTDFVSPSTSNVVTGLTETMVTSNSPAAASSFKALGDNNTTIPPDTHGAVGPNHLMVTLNSEVRIQNRTGGIISTVSLDSFWSRLGSLNTFDPKVLYDPFNNRWIFTACANPESAASALLIGVSQTSDPTANWKLYKIDVDSTNTLWADYPSIGFNKNWIVVAVNMFTVSNNSYSRENIYAFNKASMYAFGSATFKKFEAEEGFSSTPAITYDNTLSTMYLVEDWAGNSGGGRGYLRISTITGAVGSESLNTGVAFPSSTSWGTYIDGDFAPQLGSTDKIQNNDSRMQNTVYRNGSLWCAQTVFLPVIRPHTRAGVQWWELTPAGTVKQVGRIEDTTGQKFYAFPSIAVNKNNDVLVGYSSFSSQQYASANYSFRKGTDPLNTMQSSYVVKPGESPYYKTFSGDENRWGDYSATVVDPVNDLDMWVIQEYAAMPAGASLWGTWWGRVAVATATPTPTPTPTATYTISGRVMVGTSGLDGVTMKLTGSRTLTQTTASGGNYSFAGLPTGNYTVTPVRAGYTFNPAQASFNNLSANQTAANFTATANSYTISGRILIGTSPLAGVTVKLTGSRTLSATTDSLGNYKFAALTGGGNYTVTPSKVGYKFTPVSRTFTALSANQTTANFSAAVQNFSISGRVMVGTTTLAGVTMKLTGTRTLTTTTTSLGGYKFANLPAGGNYTVTPVKTGYTFNPVKTSFIPLSANQTAANFAATQN